MSDIGEKFAAIYRKFKQIEQQMSAPDVINDPARYQELSRDHGQLRPFAETYLQWKYLRDEIADQHEMLETETERDIIDMIRSELPDLEEELEQTQQTLKKLLVPKDPVDRKNAIIEIRAGTGGEEAGLFAEEIFRMYAKYAESQKWNVEQLSMSTNKGGGVKEIIVSIQGTGAYGRLRYEGGVHRVQRVPVTESGGRIHTSAVTVAVLPEVENVNEVEIDPSDLKIDVYRASGAGGQHVNTTDSAVRITHIPSKIVVTMQEERSQIQNRRKAMKILTSKLLQHEQEKHMRERAQKRKLLVGSGDRSEKIRTYNFPQGRVTDHRISLTIYSLDAVMEGDIEPVTDPLIEWQNARLLEETLSEE